MKRKVEIQKTFSVEDCKNHPEKMYIFGDNFVYQGTGGQAVIRNCYNAIGIPTKHLPSMSEDAFFSDKPEEINKVSRHLNKLLSIANQTPNTIFVFPKDGIGTGRAKLKEKSPKIYNLIDEFFKTNFNVEIMP